MANNIRSYVREAIEACITKEMIENAIFNAVSNMDIEDMVTDYFEYSIEDMVKDELSNVMEDIL